MLNPSSKRLAFIESDFSNYDRVLSAEAAALNVQYLTRGVPKTPTHLRVHGITYPASLNYYFREHRKSNRFK